MSSSLIGQTLLNQFRVDAFVAAGGMGIVYRVWDLKRNVPLAMKVLHADLAEDPSVFKRFKREANALKKLAHPNIVSFYGLYRTRYFSFLLEDFIDGPSLNDVLRYKANESLSILDIMTILKALCAALGYAHIHGVVHCDVKPGNVMIDHGGVIYLTDFGIARHAESTTTTLGFAGTPAYMTPEQIRDEPVSPATDVYSSGVLLFRMLTGRRPFRGDEEGTESAGQTAGERTRYAHLHLEPPGPRTLNQAIPEALERVVLKALAKDPKSRYQSTQELISEATSAAGMPASLIPQRVNQDILKETAALWELPAVEINVDKQIADEKKVGADPRSSRLKFWLVGLAAVVIIAIVVLAVSVRRDIFPSVFGPQPFVTAIQTKDSSEGQVVQAEEIVSTPTPTMPIPATDTKIPPTKPPPPSTKSPIPPTKTTRLPTRTPIPANPRFTAGQDMYCREGPGQSYEPHTTVNEGQTLPVLAKWIGKDWFLVEIDRTDTRTKCCWVGGEGNLNVSVNSIRQIDYLVDRIDCNLR